MGIQKFIESVCVQTAVYWGNPQPDGYGGYEFDDPIEIDCRWEEKQQQVEDKGVIKTGEIFVSQAEVLLTRDIDYGSYLYLGTLDDLYDNAESSTVTLDPVTITNAFKVHKFEKIPMIKSKTEFVRKAYL